jgi:hypothetical protein
LSGYFLFLRRIGSPAENPGVRTVKRNNNLIERKKMETTNNHKHVMNKANETINRKEKKMKNETAKRMVISIAAVLVTATFVQSASALTLKKSPSVNYPIAIYMLGPEAPFLTGFNHIWDTSTGFGFTIYWRDNSDNEEGFIVERSYMGGSWTAIARLPKNSTIYQDLPGWGYIPFTKCYYRVIAFNKYGKRSSNIITAYHEL